MRRLLAVLLALALLLSACGSDAPTPTERAQRDAAAFLDRYVAGDGRVVRHDQGSFKVVAKCG